TISKRDWSSDVCSSDLVQIDCLSQGSHTFSKVTGPQIQLAQKQVITRQFGLQLNRLLHILERLGLVVFLQIEASYPLQWQAINGDRKSTRLNSSHVSIS